MSKILFVGSILWYDFLLFLSLDLGIGYYVTNQTDVLALSFLYIFRFVSFVQNYIYAVDIIERRGAVTIVYQCLFLRANIILRVVVTDLSEIVCCVDCFYARKCGGLLFVLSSRDMLPTSVSFQILSAWQDSFTRCFKSNPPEPWNWNVYLFPLWCLGVAVRYGFLFPLRLVSTWSKIVYFL